MKIHAIFKEKFNKPGKISKKSRISVAIKESGLFLTLLGLVIMFAVLTEGRFTATSNIFNILLQSSVRGVAAVGMTFVILKGGIDLSVGGIAQLCGVFGAWMMVTKDVHLAIAIPIMLLLGCLLGSINGVAVAKLKMAPFIVTLAVWQVCGGIAYLILGGGHTIFGLPSPLAFLGQGRVLGIPVAVILFVVIAAIGYFVLHHTTFGRHVYAVGGNEISAWLSGINTTRTKFLAYVISGFCASIAALVIISRIMSASPAIAKGLELDVIAAVVIGGVSLFGGEGRITGAVIGAIIIGVINNGLNLMGVHPYLQDVAKGLIIFGAVAVDVLRKR